jgi:hypothetical protein
MGLFGVLMLLFHLDQDSALIRPRSNRRCADCVGITSTNRPPRSSSLASGAVKMAESDTGGGHRSPLLLRAAGFARYSEYA